MKNEKLLIITSVLGIILFAVFFVLTIPLLNFICKKDVIVIETPLPEDVTLYDPLYITDCGDSLSCFLDFARECEQVNVEVTDGVSIEVIGTTEDVCFLHRSGEESALCMIPLEQLSALLEDWEEAGDFLLDKISSEWCEDSLYRWQKVELSNT